MLALASLILTTNGRIGIGKLRRRFQLPEHLHEYGLAGPFRLALVAALERTFVLEEADRELVLQGPARNSQERGIKGSASSAIAGSPATPIARTAATAAALQAIDQPALPALAGVMTRRAEPEMLLDGLREGRIAHIEPRPRRAVVKAEPQAIRRRRQRLDVGIIPACKRRAVGGRDRKRGARRRACFRRVSGARTHGVAALAARFARQRGARRDGACFRRVSGARTHGVAALAARSLRSPARHPRS